MLYTSTSRALACLETVVHLAGESLPLNRYLVKLTVPIKAWKAAMVVDPTKLVGWDAEPAGEASLASQPPSTAKTPGLAQETV
jgi:hypothetical protein